MYRMIISGFLETVRYKLKDLLAGDEIRSLRKQIIALEKENDALRETNDYTESERQLIADKRARRINVKISQEEILDAFQRSRR